MRILKTMQAKMVFKTSLSIAVAAICAPGSAAAQTFFSLDSPLSGWTTDGNATGTNTTYSLPGLGGGYELTPAAGHYMAVLHPGGSFTSGTSGLASITGLNESLIYETVTGVASGGDNNLIPTNIGYMSNDINLTAGTTYEFSWAYASNDYAPYADAIFFSYSKDGNGEFIIPARTSNSNDPLAEAGTTPGYPEGTVVLESYGSTAWIKQTFTVAADGTYTITMGSFNVIDSGIHPILFVSDVSGTIIGAIVGASVSAYDSSSAEFNTEALPAASVIDATPELLALFNGLTTDTEVSDGVTQALPLLTGGSFLAARSALYGMNGAVKARQDANRGLSSGDPLLSDKHFWIKPFGTWTDQDDRKGVSGFDVKTGGLILGLDASINDQTNLGVAFAYANSNVDGNSSVAPHSLDVDSYQLVGYGSHDLNANTRLNFQADIGLNKNDGQRVIALNNTTASSNYDSYTAHVGLGLTRDYAINEANRVTAGVKADYTWIKDKSYTEAGAGLLNLDVESSTADALVLGVEGLLAHTVNQDTDLNVKLGVGYDVINDQASITSAYAGAPTAQFTTSGIDPSPWVANAGVGVLHTTEGGVEVSANYDAEYRSDYLSHSASLKLRWAF